MEDDYGGDIGGGGRNKGKKLPNRIKQDHKFRVQNPNPQNLEIEEEIEEPQRDFGDGSILVFDWTKTHLDLLGRIVEQTEDDCWARALGRILDFVYNMEIKAVAERKPLSIDGLIAYVMTGREEAAVRQNLGHIENFAIPSLRRPIQFIREIGLGKNFGRNKGDKAFKVKGRFRTEPNANTDRIKNLLQCKGPVGIYVHMEPRFCNLRDGIYILHVPHEEVMARYRRHVLIIVAYGVTADDQLFFLAQNTWGKSWGVEGYGRIIIAETTPIFYFDGLIS